MATISRRGDSYRVQVRQQGHEPLSRTFATRAEAKRWAAQVEAQIAQGRKVDRNRVARFVDLLDAYTDQIAAGRSMGRSKRQALEAIRAALGEHRN